MFLEQTFEIFRGCLRLGESRPWAGPKGGFPGFFVAGRSIPGIRIPPQRRDSLERAEKSRQREQEHPPDQ